jgi:hypothetical protein
MLLKYRPFFVFKSFTEIREKAQSFTKFLPNLVILSGVEEPPRVTLQS